MYQCVFSRPVVFAKLGQPGRSSVYSYDGWIFRGPHAFLKVADSVVPCVSSASRTADAATMAATPYRYPIEAIEATRLPARNPRTQLL